MAHCIFADPVQHCFTTPNPPYRKGARPARIRAWFFAVAVMSYRQWFHELDQLLAQHRGLWQLRPFSLRSIPWQEQWPDLAAAISRLSLPQVNALSEQPHRLYEMLGEYFPDAHRLHRLIQVPPAPIQQQFGDDERLSYEVPGRKWQQIRAFVQALPARNLPLLEWCAGKGHLGRLASQAMAAPVLSLELDPQLCQDGQRLADRLQLAQQLQPCDVLGRQVRQYFQAGQQALALHACGDLHVALLRQGCQHQVQALAISPCCYHRTREDLYQPLSTAARSTNLQLSRQDRQLAVQESVTAGQRVRRLRDQEICWRLGFDLLQRQLRGCDEYLPVPPLKTQLLTQGTFTDFCHWAAERKQLVLQGPIDFEALEQAGRQRHLQIRQLELVCQLFRRPLELWLVLDRVLFLEEQGYQVSLHEFCARNLTPRNLLIQAQRRGSASQEGGWSSRAQA